MNAFLYRAPPSRTTPGVGAPPGAGAPSQSSTLSLVGGDQYTISVYFSGAAPAAPAASDLQTALGSNYAVSNVSSNVNVISFTLGVVNSIVEKTDTFALAVGAPSGSTVTATPATSAGATPAAPGATTATSDATTTGVVTSTLIITAVVFTVVGWAVEQGLNKAFASKK